MIPTETAIPSPATLAAATLFIVPPRADRLALGRRLVGSLISARPQDHALAQRGLHPDVMELLPPSGKEKIGIDQVREVIRMAQFSAVQADRKACLAPFAEDLTPEASNALLKILEEPTRGMVFVLLAEHTGDLLPTIVSRSRVERVVPTSRAALAERLTAAGYSPREAGWLVSAATRVGELDDLTAARVPVDQARTQAQARLAAASAADLLAACLDAGPIDRREAFRALAARAHARDPELLSTGVLTLAGQERATLFVFLGELLSACADAVRDAASDARAIDPTGTATVPGKSQPLPLQGPPLRLLARGCTAVETANRALLAYTPPEAVLLSLFLAFGGSRGE